MIQLITLTIVSACGLAIGLILLILINDTDHSYRNRYQPLPKIDPPPPR